MSTSPKSPYNNALQKSIQYSNSMQMPASPEPYPSDFFNSDDLVPTSAIDIPDDAPSSSPELVIVGSRQQRITLGRGGSSTVKIGRRNRQISRTHVAIEYVNGRFELVVLGLNGVTVDRILYRQHERAPLDDFSVVDVLGDVLLFRHPPAPIDVSKEQVLHLEQQQMEEPQQEDMEAARVEEKGMVMQCQVAVDPLLRESTPVEEIPVADDDNVIDANEIHCNDDKEYQHIDGEEIAYNDDKETQHTDDKEAQHIDEKKTQHIDEKETQHIDEKETQHIDERENTYSDEKENTYSDEKENTYIDEKENTYSGEKENTYNDDKENTYNDDKENQHSQEDTTDYAENIIDILVFSRKSSMPISDICSRIIKTNPNYKKQDRAIWTERIQRVLKEKAFFGEIVRKGKTADGSPKENLYYYNSDMDPVEWRRATYTQVGRSARKCTLQDKQYFWRIPPKLGKNRHAYIPPPAAPLQEKRKLEVEEDGGAKKQKQ